MLSGRALCVTIFEAYFCFPFLSFTHGINWYSSVSFLGLDDPSAEVSLAASPSPSPSWQLPKWLEEQDVIATRMEDEYSINSPLPFVALPLSSEYYVEPPLRTNCELPAGITAEILSKGGVDKVLCPLGVHIFGTKRLSDGYMLAAASALSEMLDQDFDGVADDTAVQRQLKFGRYFMLAGFTQQEETKGCEQITKDAVIDQSRCFNLLAWTTKGPPHETDVGKVMIQEQAKAVVVQQIFQMIHKAGWAEVYPEVFGLNNFSSSVCQAMASHECLQPGWYHPQNLCPKPYRMEPPNVTEPAPVPLPGLCAEASCDCLEYYHQVSMILIGMKPAWRCPWLPTSNATMITLLGEHFETIWQDKYHQLRRPIKLKYLVSRS